MKAKAKAAKVAKEAADPKAAEVPLHVQKLRFVQDIVQNGMKLISVLQSPREAALARTKLDEFALWAQVAIANDTVQEKEAAQGQ